MSEAITAPSGPDEPPEATVLYDHDAEAALLGAMLLDGSVIAEVEVRLTAGAFHYPVHGLLFGALTARRVAGEPTDAISLVAHLVEAGKIGKIPGNGTYIHTLLERCPSSAMAMHFAGIVADRALLRDLDEALAGIRGMIRAGGSGSSADLVERARAAVADLGERASGVGSWWMWRDMIRPGLDEMERVQEHGEGPPGISTGLPDLDCVINGLQEGLVVVAGQPGSGKTTLGACDFVRAAAFHQKLPVGVFTMEMTWREIFNRLICAEAGVSAERVTAGTLHDGDWSAIARVCGETEDAQLAIDDTKGLSFADIRIRARQMRQRLGIRLLVVDYLGLIECRDNRPRHQQIDDLARRFKNLSGELGIPVVLLAQTNRNAGSRADKRPILSDLKESGGIEAHANVVIFVHRPEQSDKAKRAGEADLIVAKNRSGPERDVVVAAQLHLNRFVSMAMPEGSPL